MTDIRPITIHTKPFLKWIGGKRQLLSQLGAFLSDVLDKQKLTCIEPFVSGGAISFHITHISH
jgi:DNA adenine methylase